MPTDDEKQKSIVDETTKFIGNYIVIFQDIERRLDNILHCAFGELTWDINNIIFAELSYHSKIKCVRSIVNLCQERAKNEDVERWMPHFNDVMVKCTKEAETRNSIVHAAYEWLPVEYGGVPILTHAKVAKSGNKIKTEALENVYFEKEIQRLAVLAQEIGQVRLQLIHWNEILFNFDGPDEIQIGEILNNGNPPE